MNMTMQLNHTKYRIRVEGVTPSSASPHLFDYKKCILGVSMTNPVFWRSSLDTMLAWMQRHFDQSMILVGDYLHRHNEEILNGQQQELAIQTALETGDNFIGKLNQYLPDYNPERFIVQRWKPLYEDPDFVKAKQLLDTLYHSNPSVKASIQSTAALFVWQKQERQNFIVSKEEAIRLSSEYLLEEMAIFSMLIDRGWNVVLYPGAQLPMLMEIAKGKFKDVPNSLNKGVYVELKIRKK
ncbi:MAG: tRNA-dependent cyclodipeptide synthase [Flammeovirgaceae bacterium]